MNKLYILTLLGLSVGASSSSFYAGDCLDATSFDTDYGLLDFNCGNNCTVPSI